jgi:flagellar basal body-associated protein FliL
MDYREGFQQASSAYYWTLPRVIVAGAALFIIAGATAWVIHVASQPAAIAAKTLDADNVVANYEWFHDAQGNYLARVAQRRQFTALLAAEKDPAEKSRLRIEAAAIQQACRDLAQRYNANAAKSNRNIFMGRDVPPSLDAADCE